MGGPSRGIRHCSAPPGIWLLEFDPRHVPGLAFFSMQEELSEILGHQVDLNTPQFLSPHFREQVQDEAVVIYDQA